MRIDCTSVTKLSYSTTNCRGFVSESATVRLIDCGSNGASLNGASAYTQIQCGTPFIPTTYDYYFVHNYNSSSQCNASPTYFQLAKQEVCISSAPGSAVKYVNPYEYSYSDASCSNLDNTATVLKTCAYSSQTMVYTSNGFVSSSTTTDDNGSTNTDDGTTNPFSCSDSPCPTSCPALHGPSESWTSMTGCTVYCKDQPVNGQCASGGSGCTSSCTLAIGPVVGIAVGGAAVVAVIIGAVYFVKYGYLRSSPAMAQSEMV